MYAGHAIYKLLGNTNCVLPPLISAIEIQIQLYEKIGHFYIYLHAWVPTLQLLFDFFFPLQFTDDNIRYPDGI